MPVLTYNEKYKLLYKNISLRGGTQTKSAIEFKVLEGFL
jgi:hypothetical protein